MFNQIASLITFSYLLLVQDPRLDYCSKHAEYCKLLGHHPFVIKVHKNFQGIIKVYVMSLFALSLISCFGLGQVSNSEVCRLDTIKAHHSSGVTNAEF